MLGTIKRCVKKLFVEDKDRKIPVLWVKKGEGSWLQTQLPDALLEPANSAFSSRIEKLARDTDKVGPQPLWEGYEGHNVRGPTRTPNGVRTNAHMGNFYTWLVQKWKPETIVEFGTAFGVSGMYFLAGLESNQKGHLMTFDPNDGWRKLAVGCLSAISSRFTSVAGTFEENIDSTLGDKRIDIAFIDAIHTREFVIPQLELVMARCSAHALIILDDITFSDSMRACWQEVANDSRFVSSVALGRRVGIVEFMRT
jgi:predicted O-methyltransferase YrrM